MPFFTGKLKIERRILDVGIFPVEIGAARANAEAIRKIIEVVRRSDDQKGYTVLPRRCVVARTFGWMTQARRLARNYEKRIDVSRTVTLSAMGGNLIRKSLTIEFQNGLSGRQSRQVLQRHKINRTSADGRSA